MEQLLHYVWKHKLFPLKPLQTTGGESVEVIDSGIQNLDAGPDFFNAKLKINGTLWVGNVEIHVHASDWLRHGHQHDKAYDSVVLHVVEEADCAVFRTTGEEIPQLVLTCSESVQAHYQELQAADRYPACYAILSSLPTLTVHSWMTALQTERLEQKSRLITQRLSLCEQNWEQAFFITLARNFGFGLNGDAFEQWASLLPFHALAKHRNELFQIETFFYGVAGLLQEEKDEYQRRMAQEYRYLQHKFEWGKGMDASQWRFLRLRPDNFPHVRLAQLAWLYQKEDKLFSRLLEAETLADVRALLSTRTSVYWESHFVFGSSSPVRVKALGERSKDLIIINTVVPFLYAYGLHKADGRLCERASRFLEELKPEDNHILRSWAVAGLSASHAADSQALIQLRKEYCDKHQCLRCRFGYEFLRRK